VIERLSIQSSEKLEKVSGLDKRQTEKRETDRQATEKQAGEEASRRRGKQARDRDRDSGKRQEAETEKRQEVGGGEQPSSRALFTYARELVPPEHAEHAETSSDSHARCRAASTKQPR